MEKKDTFDSLSKLEQQQQIKNRRCECSTIILIFGMISLVSSVCSYYSAQLIIQSQVHKNVLLKNGSRAYDFWTKPPANIIRQYFIFDVRNPIEVQAGKAKPIVIERGPYSYSEVWKKEKVDFFAPDRVSYTPTVTLHFERSLSVGDESDMVTFLNVPAVGMIEQSTRSESIFYNPTAVNSLLEMFGTKLFETKTVGELISGYKDPLMTLAKMFMPSVIKDDKFSLINGKNGTQWQNYTIMTGSDLATNVAKIISWNGLEKLNFWSTENANLINGTDGTYYPPFRTRDQVVYAYNPDMCRSYNLVYKQDNEIDGIKVYDFHLPSNIFYNATLNPANEGFCKGPCLGNGVLNISSCYGGVSGFVSQPHFLNAESKFVDDFEGLHPNSEDHDFLLHFEPTTGVPISGDIRLQINFFLPNVKRINLVKRVKPMLFPLFWFNETYVLNEDTRSQLRDVALLANLSIYIPIALAAVGSLFIVIFPIIIIRRKYTRKCVKCNDKVASNTADENASLINSKNIQTY